MERKETVTTKTNGVVSYSFSNASIPLETLSLRTLLDRMTEQHPHKVVFTFNMNNGLDLTYLDIKSKSYSLAASLVFRLGLRKGERIAYLLPNTHELLIFYFAASIAGLISVPLDADYGTGELDYMIKKTEPSAVVVFNCQEYQKLISDLFPDLNSDRSETFKSNTRFRSVRSVIVVNDNATHNNLALANSWDYNQLTNNSFDLDLNSFPSVDSDDVFAILFTSGTTSRPKAQVFIRFKKGISVRYFSILNNINIYTKLIGQSENEEENQTLTICQTTLMYHVGAMFMIICAMTSFRYRVVFPSYKFDLIEIMRAVQKYKCNSISCLPKILSNLIDHPKRQDFDLSSLEWIVLGGQLVTAELCQRVIKELGVKKFGIGYGMTEVNIISYEWLDLDEKIPDSFTSCVGQPLPFIECKIVDPETGRIQPLNIEGELHLRGYSITNEYWNDPEVSSKLIDKNGWLNTGDIFTMDKEGLLYFKSRSKEIITTKGSGRLDVYPSIVESVLLRHPSIIEAIVFGIAVNVYEQELCAWIKVRSEGEKIKPSEVIKFCAERLVDYQVPKFVKLVDEFPANKMGKYVRAEMSRRFKQELGI